MSGEHGHILRDGSHTHPELGITEPSGEHGFHFLADGNHTHPPIITVPSGGHSHLPLGIWSEHDHAGVRIQFRIDGEVTTGVDYFIEDANNNVVDSGTTTEEALFMVLDPGWHKVVGSKSGYAGWTGFTVESGAILDVFCDLGAITGGADITFCAECRQNLTGVEYLVEDRDGIIISEEVTSGEVLRLNLPAGFYYVTGTKDETRPKEGEGWWFGHRSFNVEPGEREQVQVIMSWRQEVPV